MRYSETGPRNASGVYIGNITPLKNNFPDCKIKFTKNYHYVSGFVGFPSGRWVYFCSMDDRNGQAQYYVRTAAHEKDYTGGTNHFTKSNKKEELFELIRKLST